MKPASRLLLAIVGSTVCVAPAAAQVPDLLNALDAGGRAMGMGGANNATNVDTLASYYNPAALGYLDAKEVGLAYRNLPKSRTSVSGNFNDPSQSSDGEGGSRAFSHAGFAAPVRSLLGRGSGTLGFAYTIGGYIDDTTTGSNLNDDPLTLSNYSLRRKAEADFYSLSYGKAVSSGLSYGFGVVLASQTVEYHESANATLGGSPVPYAPLDASSTGTGVGAIAGVLFTPSTAHAWTIGISLRSPISLSGNGATHGEYDQIPGRALLGATWRKEGFRNGKDYLLLGGQVQQFFGGHSSTFFDRSSQTVFGLGGEYNLGIEQGTIPLRVGFTTATDGGQGYGERNAFTFGFGLRPNRAPVGLDLNYAVPDKGGYDFSISATYRFK